MSMNFQFLISNFKFSIVQVMFLLLIYGLSVMAFPVMAATGTPSCDSTTELQTDFGCFKVGDVNDFTTKLYGIGLGFIGGVALLFIIWGGYLILTSQGEIQKLQKGRSYIISSILGIILAVGGFVFYQIVAVDVLKIPGFK
jgi:hypothetical protein